VPLYFLRASVLKDVDFLKIFKVIIKIPANIPLVCDPQATIVRSHGFRINKVFKR